jgi:hypothetical protein
MMQQLPKLAEMSVSIAVHNFFKRVLGPQQSAVRVVGANTEFFSVR